MSTYLLSILAVYSSTVSAWGSSQHHPPHSWDSTQLSSSCSTLPTTTALMSTTPATCSAMPTFTYTSWKYTALTTTRYATPLPSPFKLTTSYAPHFSQASTLLPSGVIYTTYSLDRSLTSLQDGTYGQGAYARMWAPLSYNTSVPFTTTVSPTPLASSELIYPPPLYTACPGSADDCVDCYKLPSNFIWGLAGSAFQIEGGLTEAGRGPSQIDMFGALPNTAGYANAEVADMNYYLYKQDIARLAAIGAPFYSFSISWTRIVPFGTVNSPINIEALKHYDDLINTCLEYGIQPIVTLSHNDAPRNVTYVDPSFPDAFLYYSKFVMTRYADRVSNWVTLNEPNIGFGLEYFAARYILLGHAKVYHWYKETLKGTGQITMKFANNLALPLDSTNPNDTVAALRYQDYILGLIGYPIFLGQNFPQSILSTTSINLTALTESELSYIKDTADYFAFDPYTAGFATSPPGGIEACAADPTNPLWPTCVLGTNVQQDGWLNGQGSFAYAYIAPQYVRQQLGFVWNVLRPKGVLIAEFGFNPYDEFTRTVVAQRYDLERTLYYQWFLRETLKSIYEDGVNVIGTLAWSFLDNDEFVSYDQQYGLQHVNRTDGKFTRSFKRSIFDFVDFFHEFVER
ncbi:glycoside hydrolase family 1 protein [Acrodontium crateriforme]|uniref:Glycoside hydrolase family 1 protein n=1 Tax=Acrodontium crateriforme TaxID=150365 RepID=A0AAQ3M2Z0_9PEZI|nr:glycoside hydrolase family 1 protein [Acrodontium crateriforme]